MTESAGRADGPDVDGLLSGFAADLDAQPLAANTRRPYQSRVRGFLEWLAATPAEGDPLADPHARDSAVRDYAAHLKTTGQVKPSSLNLSLAAIHAFYRHLGLGQVNAAREALPGVSPRALEGDEQNAFCAPARPTPPPATAP